MARDAIIWVTVRGYRSIGEVTFAPDAQRAAIVGANGAGKSSLLDAIQLVGDLVRHGESFQDGALRGSLPTDGVAVRVPIREMMRAGGKRLEIELAFRVGGRAYDYSIALDALRDGYAISAERLLMTGAPVPLIERDSAGARALRSGTVDERQEFELEPVGSKPTVPVIQWLSDDVRYPLIAPAFNFLAGICTLRLTPALMRGGVNVADEPDRYGRDLQWRLAKMLTEASNRVPHFLAFMGDFVGWTNIKASIHGSSVRVSFQEADHPSPIAISQASDGSVIEAYLAALALDPPDNVSVFLFDEPGMTFLPRAMQRPAELLTSLSTSKQVIVATHAAGLVDYFSDLTRTWVITRSPGQGSVLRRLADIPQSEEHVRALGLGEGALAHAPTLPESAE